MYFSVKHKLHLFDALIYGLPWWINDQCISEFVIPLILISWMGYVLKINYLRFSHIKVFVKLFFNVSSVCPLQLTLSLLKFFLKLHWYISSLYKNLSLEDNNLVGSYIQSYILIKVFLLYKFIMVTKLGKRFGHFICWIFCGILLKYGKDLSISSTKVFARFFLLKNQLTLFITTIFKSGKSF